MQLLASHSHSTHLDKRQHRFKPGHQRLQEAIVALALLRRRLPRHRGGCIGEVGDALRCHVAQREQLLQLLGGEQGGGAGGVGEVPCGADGGGVQVRQRGLQAGGCRREVQLCQESLCAQLPPAVQQKTIASVY